MTREEHGPRAHEKIRADEGGGDEHNGLAEPVGNESTDDGHDDRNDPPAPSSIPARGRGDEGEDESTAEEAANEAEKRDHAPDLPANEAAGKDTKDEGNSEDGNESTSGVHPAESEAETTDDGNDEDSDKRCGNVREPLEAEEREERAKNEVNDTNAPLVVGEPAVVLGKIVDRAASITLDGNDELATILEHDGVSHGGLGALLAHNSGGHAIVNGGVFKARLSTLLGELDTNDLLVIRVTSVLDGSDIIGGNRFVCDVIGLSTIDVETVSVLSFDIRAVVQLDLYAWRATIA